MNRLITPAVERAVEDVLERCADVHFIERTFDGLGVPDGEFRSAWDTSEVAHSLGSFMVSLDLTVRRDAETFLRFIETVISRLDLHIERHAVERTGWGISQRPPEPDRVAIKLRDHLFSVLGHSSIDVAGGRLSLRHKSPYSLEDSGHLSTEDVVQDHVRRINEAIAAGRFDDAVGRAKNLVESIARLVIRHFKGEQPSNKATLNRLSAQALENLGLNPNQAKGRAKSESIEDASVRVLQGLVAIVNGMAELRNKSKVAHGDVGLSKCDSRHANLAAGAATTWARFIVSTLDLRSDSSGATPTEPKSTT